MADDPNISDGLGGTVPISADDAGGKYVQRVKLAYSADGAATHVTADSSGLLVNLGANNDVTVTSGTVAVSAGTVTVGGTANVSIVGGTAVISGALAAGTALIGRVLLSDGTYDGDFLALTSSTAVAVGIVDTSGSQLTFASPLSIQVTPSVKTTAYASASCLDGTILTFASAAVTSGGSGWITKLVLLDKDGAGLDHQFFFLSGTVTMPTEGSAFSISDTDAERIVGVVDTSTGSWYSYGGGSVNVTTVGPPIPYQLLTGTSLYAAASTKGTATYSTATALVTTLHVLRD